MYGEPASASAASPRGRGSETPQRTRERPERGHPHAAAEERRTCRRLGRHRRRLRRRGVAAGHPPGQRGQRASVSEGGVNAALFQYGDAQLAYYGKQRARGDARPEARYLGYSTTAFYFYNQCDCLDPAPKDPSGRPNPHVRRSCGAKGAASTPIPARFLQRSAVRGTCQSYEDTLLAVDAALREAEIPYGNMLLDSWW